MSEVPWIEAATLGQEDAHATWALAARMRLEEVAADYHAVISTAELADWVQQRSRIRTRAQHRHWMGDVLYRTMQENAERGEPFLAALVVDGSGRVGSAYAGCVHFLRGAAPADPDGHAAAERLDCYRWFGATLPEGGGVPGPLPRAAAPRRAGPGRAPATRTAGSRPSSSRGSTRVAKTDVVPKICPRCFMALPASGQCDTCD